MAAHRASSRQRITLRLRMDAAGAPCIDVQDAGIGVAQKGVAQAREAYDVAVARYQEHVGTNFDVLDASSNLKTAHSSLTGAKADYLTALAQLYVAMGEFHPDVTRAAARQNEVRPKK